MQIRHKGLCAAMKFGKFLLALSCVLFIFLNIQAGKIIFILSERHTSVQNTSLHQKSSERPQLVSLCESCHGQDGLSSSPTIPNIAGQNKHYLIEAMSAYRSGRRTGGQADAMAAVVSGLTESDINVLASYYGSKD